jgi:head-tail adaptor
MIGLNRISIAERPHRVTVQTPGTAVPDADGGFTQAWADAVPPTWQVSIMPATARDLERVTSGTVMASASHVVTGPYHPQVTTLTRLLFGSRVLQVTGVQNPEERNRETIAICEEVVQ